MAQNFFYKQDTLPNLTEDASLVNPTQIGPYKIEGLISKGGMSFLYLGIHPDTKKPLAIKILSPQYVSDNNAVERFLKEAHIISLSNHPNIVKLYGEGKWEKGLYIAMEWIRGISLRQFIMQQSLSLRRALEIILQVSYALHHLHSHSIIHRDLKPENILITEEGSVKVIDFGIAQVIGDKSSLALPKQGIMGTPNYMSPEQKEDASRACFSSDIYSLGIISYELILGKLSYGMIELELLPRGLRRIIGKSLAISPDERYKNISEFVNDISRYLNSGEIEKDRPGTDQMKELNETFLKISQNISFFSNKDWPQLEIGTAKNSLPTQFGLYSEIFKLSSGSFLCVLSEVDNTGIESLSYISNFRGVFRSLIHTLMMDSKTRWDLVQITQELNRIVKDDPISQKFAFSCLLLDPINEQLQFINCGMCNLIHISSEGNFRILSSSNDLLGQETNPVFSEIRDNWYISDAIIIHSLSPSYRSEEYQQKQTEKTLLDTLSEDSFLSAQPQADALMKKVLYLSYQREQKNSKILISIQRVG